MLIVLQKQKQKWPPTFVFATPPRSDLMGKQKQKLGHLVISNQASQSSCLRPSGHHGPLSLLALLVFSALDVASEWFLFPYTAQKQSTRHTGVRIMARGLVFAEKMHITCWLFIFSLLQRRIASFSSKSAVPLLVYCYCWSVEGYYWFRELRRCRKGGRKGRKGGSSRYLIVEKYLPIPSQVLYPSNPLQKRGVVFVVLRVFLELNIFTMRKISFCSADKLGIFRKQKRKL